MRVVLFAIAGLVLVCASGVGQSSPSHISGSQSKATQSKAAQTEARPTLAARQTKWEKELTDADSEFCRQTAARRLEGWMDFFADDAATLQNGKTISGKADLRKYYEPIFANKDFTITWTPTHAEAAKDGTLGYTYGTYEARDGTDASRGMYLTLWRRINGHWKVVMDTGSTLRGQPQ